MFAQNSLRWLSLNLIDDKSILFQVIAWCHQATSHLPEPVYLHASLLFALGTSWTLTSLILLWKCKCIWYKNCPLWFKEHREPIQLLFICRNTLARYLIHLHVCVPFGSFRFGWSWTEAQVRWSLHAQCQAQACVIWPSVKPRAFWQTYACQHAFETWCPSSQTLPTKPYCDDTQAYQARPLFCGHPSYHHHGRGLASQGFDSLSGKGQEITGQSKDTFSCEKVSCEGQDTHTR